MKSSFKLLLIAFLFISGCKAKKMAAVEPEYVEKVELVENTKSTASFSIAAIDNIDKQDLLFHIKDLVIKDKTLLVQVQYGGGCVKPHVFELVTDGVIDKDGIMDFYLLHKTHNDMCKALLFEDLSFDLAQLYSLKSSVLKNIRVNKLPKIDLK